jgi:hypothetical protein
MAPGRRRLGGGLLVFGAVLLAPGWAAAGLAERVGATFILMADDFIEAAQPVEGMVLAVDGDVLYIDFDAGRGGQPGRELAVIRRGESFHHPFTGKVLGHYEDVLGWAQIRRVEPRFAEAVFFPAPNAPPPRPEDGVRISRARIQIAVTPVLDLTSARAELRRVPYILASVLERSKRFLAVDPLAVTDMFAAGTLKVEEMLSRPQRAIRVARNLEVSGWLVPVLLERAGRIYLDVTWISATTGTALLSRRLPLVPAGATEERRFPWEPRAGD